MNAGRRGSKSLHCPSAPTSSGGPWSVVLKGVEPSVLPSQITGCLKVRDTTEGNMRQRGRGWVLLRPLPLPRPAPLPLLSLLGLSPNPPPPGLSTGLRVFRALELQPGIRRGAAPAREWGGLSCSRSLHHVGRQGAFLLSVSPGASLSSPYPPANGQSCLILPLLVCCFRRFFYPLPPVCRPMGECESASVNVRRTSLVAFTGCSRTEASRRRSSANSRGRFFGTSSRASSPSHSRTS